MDTATMFLIVSAAVALIVYGAAFGDDRAARADWTRRQ